MHERYETIEERSKRMLDLDEWNEAEARSERRDIRLALLARYGEYSAPRPTRRVTCYGCNGQSTGKFVCSVCNGKGYRTVFVQDEALQDGEGQ